MQNLNMRDKELRLALICYGGISLAVYMHGVTKEVWRLAAASRARLDNAPPSPGSTGIYRRLLDQIQAAGNLRLRVMADIVAGSSAGGINGVFLARAIASGQSLEPLTDLWLNTADVDMLLDPDARPLSAATKFWAAPIAWAAMKRSGNAIDRSVGGDGQDEVRTKLSRFVRARWFQPPFGGATFCGLLLDAFDAMAAQPAGPPLVPDGHPVDLFVSATDFAGHDRQLALNSPAMVTERAHGIMLGFSRAEVKAAPGRRLDDDAALVASARATASFPGAFPPFTVRELDRVLAARGRDWPGRAAFIAAQLPPGPADSDPADRALIDGSVLANAPFRPAIAALRQRPARRQVDRRFVTIDPKAEAGGNAAAPAPVGFFSAILGALITIPREQPIGDNVEALSQMSARIRRTQKIIDAMGPEVEGEIAAALGRTFFLDRPTPARLARWRAKAAEQAAARAGFAYLPYAHLKLSLVVEGVAALAARLDGGRYGATETMRLGMWTVVRTAGLDRLAADKGSGTPADAIAFFRAHDLDFRIRRLRFLARSLDGRGVGQAGEPLRRAVFAALGDCAAREADAWFAGLAANPPATPAAWLAAIADQRDLAELDAAVDAALAPGFEALERDDRRALLLGYIGYAFYDAAMLPLMQGGGFDEFDPVRVDRISPADANAIRSGGAGAVLKGIEFNSFGAFFSRAYRENDYLWGRLNGADRLIDIVASAAEAGGELAPGALAALKREAFQAILAEEAPRLTQIAPLIAGLAREISPP